MKMLNQSFDSCAHRRRQHWPAHHFGSHQVSSCGQGQHPIKIFIILIPLSELSWGGDFLQFWSAGASALMIVYIGTPVINGDAGGGSQCGGRRWSWSVAISHLFRRRRLDVTRSFLRMQPWPARHVHSSVKKQKLIIDAVSVKRHLSCCCCHWRFDPHEEEARSRKGRIEIPGLTTSGGSSGIRLISSLSQLSHSHMINSIEVYSTKLRNRFSSV